MKFIKDVEGFLTKQATIGAPDHDFFSAVR